MVVRTSSRETRQRKASIAQSRTPKFADTAHDSPAWDDKEDALLREAVTRCGPKRWREIAGMMAARRKNRSKEACHERWIALTNQGETPVKKKWTPAEDASLEALVEQHDFKNWALIASELPGRSAKQCRERWQNQLRPELNQGPWAPSEDAVIVAWQQSIGNKWATIAEKLVGRTDNMVKNRWYSTLARETAPNGVRQEAATAKRKRERKPSRSRSKPKKRKYSSSSSPKKKKKHVSRPTKNKRLTAQVPDAQGQAVESPDAVNDIVEAKKGFPSFEHMECEVGDDSEDTVKPELCELADMWCGFRQVKDDRFDDWVPDGVLDEAPNLLDPTSWDPFDHSKLLVQGLGSDCDDDSGREDDEMPCHPTAVVEFSLEL